MPPLILASTSPRRKQLLQDAGVEFTAIASPADELHDERLDFITLCRHNAAAKARAVADQFPNHIVIGADTLVSLDGIPLGKPNDATDAQAMLARLSGKTNEVCTAVCLCFPDQADYVFHEISTVYFRTLDDETIRRYMSLVNTLDKAGAYAVQEYGEMIIERTEGDFSNIVGLPVSRLLAELEKHQ